MFLAVELDAELLDELQLRFQKIDVLFLVDEQVVIELLGDEVVGGNAIFSRLGVERTRGGLGVEVTAKNFLHRLSDPQRVEDLEVRESFQKKNTSGQAIGMVHFLDRLYAPFLRQIFIAPIIEDTIMKPILIDIYQLAVQAAIEIVEDSVVAPHCSKLSTAWRSCRRNRDDGRGATPP